MFQMIRQIVHVSIALAALAPAAFAGSWSTELMGGMNVQLYTPTSAPKLAGKRALMINLHGCSQTATEMRAGNDWESDPGRLQSALAELSAAGIATASKPSSSSASLEWLTPGRPAVTPQAGALI